MRTLLAAVTDRLCWNTNVIFAPPSAYCRKFVCMQIRLSHRRTWEKRWFGHLPTLPEVFLHSGTINQVMRCPKTLTQRLMQCRPDI